MNRRRTISIEKNLNCFFVADLHGSTSRYEKLFARIAAERPAALFMGGDILPSPFTNLATATLHFSHSAFINDFLVKELLALKKSLGNHYPRVFTILGNDDGRIEEETFLEAASRGVLDYCHNHRLEWGDFAVYGYSYIPPTPFLLKDWERFDVSRYVDPDSTPPEEGMHSVPVSEYDMQFATIAEDLEKLTGQDNMQAAIMLFHAPPYNCNLDRAALDGQMIDHVPIDVHVGSIAIQRFIETRQPLLTLHGHVHESARITGAWRDKFNATQSFSAAHDGPELALVRFNPYNPTTATRELI